MKNPEFIIECNSSIGPIGVIKVSRLKNKPADLPYPYEYFCKKDHLKFVNSLNAYLEKQLANDDMRVKPTKPGCQTAKAYFTPVKYGYKLKVFVIAYEPGGTGDLSGITKEQWDKIVTTVQSRIYRFLGSDAEIYAEPWDKKYKFKLVYQTYVMNIAGPKRKSRH